ncbi:MAG: DNA polymerase III subunit delta [Lachnospiraceae bacterium]|nr:DNA polymerase III subunit delta [Lachnospiraceae bacterium]
MKQLDEQIKKGIFKHIYVLTGPQSYIRKQYVSRIVRQFVPEGDSMNCTFFSGKKTEVREVIELAETMPFFADRRVIVLEDTGLFEHPCEELADYIPNIPETACLIFSEEKANGTLRQTKAAKSEGCIEEFSDLSEKELRDFVFNRLVKEHRPITEAALDLFLERCGTDLWQVSNELEKIISYTFGKDGIRPADVESVCPPLPEDKIFKMISAILDHDLKTAMDYYKDLVLLRSDPLGMLALIREQYRLLFHVSEMKNENVSPKEMPKILGMSPKRVEIALQTAGKSSKIRLSAGIEKCAETDERIKSGRIDPQVGIETLIAELCLKN